MIENKLVCPDCGCALDFSYEREDGTKVYYCPDGDEEYIFVKGKGNEYVYCECLWDGKKTCVGVYNEDWKPIIG